MEAAPLELVEGHIHQAWDNAFTSLLEVWPTPRAGYWHVWMRAPQSHATEEPLSGDLVPELLEEWGFAAEQWRHGEVDPQPTIQACVTSHGFKWRLVTRFLPAPRAGGGQGSGLGGHVVVDRDREAAALAAQLGADPGGAGDQRAAARGGPAPAPAGDLRLVATLGACLAAVRSATLAELAGATDVALSGVRLALRRLAEQLEPAGIQVLDDGSHVQLAPERRFHEAVAHLVQRRGPGHRGHGRHGPPAPNRGGPGGGAALDWAGRVGLAASG